MQPSRTAHRIPETSDSTDVSAWFSLDYALSIQDLRGLGWLRWRMDAISMLGENGLANGDHVFARRLAFVKHLVQSGRLSEEVTRP